MGIERFHEVLSRHHPNGALRRPDAAEALRNLTGFLEVLMRINEREKLVARDVPDRDRRRVKWGGHAGE